VWLNESPSSRSPWLRPGQGNCASVRCAHQRSEASRLRGPSARGTSRRRPHTDPELTQFRGCSRRSRSCWDDFPVPAPARRVVDSEAAAGFRPTALLLGRPLTARPLRNSSTTPVIVAVSGTLRAGLRNTYLANAPPFLRGATTRGSWACSVTITPVLVLRRVWSPLGLRTGTQRGLSLDARSHRRRTMRAGGVVLPAILELNSLERGCSGHARNRDGHRFKVGEKVPSSSLPSPAGHQLFRMTAAARSARSFEQTPGRRAHCRTCAAASPAPGVR